jgi:hypothetical protein
MSVLSLFLAARSIALYRSLLPLTPLSLLPLSPQFVDDVLLDAPYSITKMMVASLKISVVVRGSVQPEGEKWDPVDDEYREEHTDAHHKLLSPPTPQYHERDPYRLPREMGILHVVASENELTGTASPPLSYLPHPPLLSPRDC